jgi:gliding motility-associated-like protein
VEELPAPEVTTSATPPSISVGETSQLNASGLINYEWEPAPTLTDPTIANPIASPTETTVYTVWGDGGNGCAGTGTVEVNVKGEAIINRLRPVNFFSPNGDAINNFWTIENILTASECLVRVFDDKGIKVFEAKPYLNDWDGTFNGRTLPDGVYFYIIRCDGEENNPKTGSITLLR